MNPTVIKWARETAGLGPQEAATALDIDVERLLRIEAGAEPVTRPVLVRMSRVFRRSLLTFYLSSPPRKGNRGQDFRTLPSDRKSSDDATLDALVRDLLGRQNMVKAIIESEEGGEPLPFIGSKSLNEKPSDVLASIVATLQLSLQEFRSSRSVDEAFGYLRQQAESAGIFVLLAGNLGSHHTAIPVEAFRGFAIADRIAPFVVVNDQDAKSAWCFTLLHELAHLWLGTTGISGAKSDLAIERFCNEVASGFLLPTQEASSLRLSNEVPLDVALMAIEQFARARHVSRAMVAYALAKLGHISITHWKTLDTAIQRASETERARRREMSKARDGGPSYYVVRRHKLGRALMRLVQRNLAAGTLTPVRAARVLGVKPRSVARMLESTLG